MLGGEVVKCDTFLGEVDHEAVQSSEVLSHCFPLTSTSKLCVWLCSYVESLVPALMVVSLGTLPYSVGRDAPVGCCATWGNS